MIYDGDVDAAKAARVSLLEGPPEAIDAGLEKTRSETLPKVRAINGNVGAIGLADRDNGRVSIITLWDSGDSMRASAQEADQLRQRTAELSDQQIANVALYDVSMAQTVAGARGLSVGEGRPRRSGPPLCCTGGRLRAGPRVRTRLCRSVTRRPLTHQTAGGTNHEPASAELDDVLAQDLSRLAVADVVVERPAGIGELPLAIRAPRGPEQLSAGSGAGANACR